MFALLVQKCARVQVHRRRAQVDARNSACEWGLREAGESVDKTYAVQRLSIALMK